jgi:hypothetical protein
LSGAGGSLPDKGTGNQGLQLRRGGGVIVDAEVVDDDGQWGILVSKADGAEEAVFQGQIGNALPCRQFSCLPGRILIPPTNNDAIPASLKPTTRDDPFTFGQKGLQVWDSPDTTGKNGSSGVKWGKEWGRIENH